jgi:hypothetical protein
LKSACVVYFAIFAVYAWSTGWPGSRAYGLLAAADAVPHIANSSHAKANRVQRMSPLPPWFSAQA